MLLTSHLVLCSIFGISAVYCLLVSDKIIRAYL